MDARISHRMLVAAALTAAGLSACNGVPDEVIQPEQMAQLMADVHTGESVVEMNRSDYVTDSMVLALKQSIYERHGVTAAQVDTSFMWYGRHIDRYMEVYDRTIEILEERLAEKGSLIAAEAAMSVSGDSVEVWTSPSYAMYSDRMPSHYLAFDLKRDPNWEPGDTYTWRIKLVLGGVGSTWQIVGDYDDGITEVINASIVQTGWNEISFRSDTTRTLRCVYGNLMLTSDSHGYRNDDSGETRVWADSISLVRGRLNRQTYPQRYRQRIYNFKP